MNYDEARQLPEGGWHWTSLNDGRIRTAPPCISFKTPFDPTKPYKPVAPEDVVRCIPHASKQEAERHFYDYCLGQLKEQIWDTYRECQAGCGELTNKTLSNAGFGGYFRLTFLCDQHRTSEWVAELHKFQPDIQRTHS